MNIKKMATLAAILLMSAFAFCVECHALEARSGQKVFETAEEALQALHAALKAEDTERMRELFGRDSRDFFETGDPVHDKARLRRLALRFDQRAELVPVHSENYDNEQWYRVRFGIEGWNMHIPLVNRGEGWSYAAEYASDTDKRIRRAVNEVAVVDTLRALVYAQEEYKSKDHNADGVLEYAQKFLSTPGKRDGLYWQEASGNEASPLDGIIARAIADGYEIEGKKSQPYGGYMYKILSQQGGKTRGGKRSYLKDGRLVGGFALLAYPIKWGSSGDATFMVSNNNQVWKKDLGSSTERIASSITSMDLDSTWVRVDPNLGGKNSRSNW